MNKEELHDRAALYAIGALPESEAAVFEMRLREDFELQQLAHEWQRFNELDALQSPVAEPPFRTLSRIMGTIDEEAREDTAPEPARRRPATIAWLAWGGWAAAACALIALGLVTQRPAAPRGGTLGDMVLTELGRPGSARPIPASDRQANMEDRMVELADLAEAYWFSRSTTESDAAAGFSLFDPKLKIGFLAVENLPEGQDGMSYHVWAKADGAPRPVRAGTLPLGRQSSGLFYFDLSSNQEIAAPGSAVTFFVTEEATNDPAAPAGNVVLGL